MGQGSIAGGSREEKIEELVRELLSMLGYDTREEGLRDTPRRVAEALREIIEREEDDSLGVWFAETGPSLVVVAGIKFHSLCEHHLLPFFGFAHIAYRPSARIVGLSKLVRLVREKSKGLNIQERLTRSIAEGVEELTGTRDVLVVTEAIHTCMGVRGVRQFTPIVVVEARGVFRENTLERLEVLNLIAPYRVRAFGSL